jgi:hemolysin activation/secretion protein
VNVARGTGRQAGAIGKRLRGLRAIVGTALLGAAVLPSGAGAQAPPAALQAVPQGSPIPRVLPPTPPSVSPAGPLVAPAAPGGEVPNRPVRVTAVSVEGVTAYPAAEIAALTAGLVGPAVPLPQIDAARLAIVQHYRADGYVLVAVSANLDAGTGRLRFIVTEGQIASVRLDGDIGPAGTQVLRFLNHLTEQHPIDEATLERYLLLAQSVPGVTVHAALQPSADQPGALNLVAQVSRQVVSGLATVDNRAFVHTGPIEALGVIDANSFTEFGEKTELSIFHAFPDSETFGQAAVEVFLGSSGLKLRLYGGSGASTPTGALGEEDYNGITTVFGAQLSYPIILTRQQTLDTHLNFDGIQSSIDLGMPAVLHSYDALRVARLGVDYARSDLLLGNDRSAINAASFRVSQGLHILGATPDGDVTAPRVGERTSFTKVDFQLSRTQTLFSPWTGASVALLARMAGQYSGDVLPPTEQFYLGGIEITRGYYSGQVVGDKALATTLELQLNTSFDLSSYGLADAVSTQFYTFYDWGEVWSNLAADAKPHVNSVGGGVRMQFTPAVELDLEGLARLNRFPTGSGANMSELYGGAFYWRVVVRY